MYSKIEEYLKRINYRDTRILPIQLLKDLHRHHVFSIPFENLDVHLNKPILLDEESLTQKIIRSGRGGYCYEMNGLFALMLKKLRFNVSYLAARVRYNVLPGITVPRMHMLLKVNFSGHVWLCDVGFGGNGLLEPIPLLVGDYGDFQLRMVGNKYLLSVLIKGRPKELYEFTLEEYLPEDFIPFNYFQSNSDKSPMAKNILCTMPTTTGRVTLEGQSLKIRTGDATKTIEIANWSDYQKALQEHFNIEIPPVPGLQIKASNASLFLLSRDEYFKR